MNTPVVLSLQVTNLKLPGVLLECTLSNPLTSEILGNTKEGSRIQMLTLPGTRHVSSFEDFSGILDNGGRCSQSEMGS